MYYVQIRYVYINKSRDINCHIMENALANGFWLGRILTDALPVWSIKKFVLLYIFW